MFKAKKNWSSETWNQTVIKITITFFGQIDDAQTGIALFRELFFIQAQYVIFF